FAFVQPRRATWRVHELYQQAACRFILVFTKLVFSNVSAAPPISRPRPYGSYPERSTIHAARRGQGSCHAARGRQPEPAAHPVPADRAPGTHRRNTAGIRRTEPVGPVPAPGQNARRGSGGFPA